MTTIRKATRYTSSTRTKNWAVYYVKKNPFAPSKSLHIIKGRFHFPIYIWRTEGQESKEPEPKYGCSTTQEHLPSQGSAYGCLIKHNFWTSTQYFPALCYKLVTGIPEIANPLPVGKLGRVWNSWTTQANDLWSPQPLQACYIRVFRAPHKSYFLRVSRWVGKLHSSDLPVSQYPGF